MRKFRRHQLKKPQPVLASLMVFEVNTVEKTDSLDRCCPAMLEPCPDLEFDATIRERLLVFSPGAKVKDQMMATISIFLRRIDISPFLSDGVRKLLPNTGGQGTNPGDIIHDCPNARYILHLIKLGRTLTKLSSDRGHSFRSSGNVASDTASQHLETQRQICATHWQKVTVAPGIGNAQNVVSFRVVAVIMQIQLASQFLTCFADSLHWKLEVRVLCHCESYPTTCRVR